jgi:hypothetical protein
VEEKMCSPSIFVEEKMCSPQYFCGVIIVQLLVFFVVFCGSLFVLFLHLTIILSVL